MKLTDISIGRKIFIAFMLVVTLFTAIGAFQIWKMNILSGLQDEGAVRSREALQLAAIQTDVAKIYTIVGDAVINRNLTEARSEIEVIAKGVSPRIEAVRLLADTAEEKRFAQEFAVSYSKYVDLINHQLLPLLSRNGDTASIRRLDDEIDKARVASLAVLATMVNSLVDENTAADQLYDETGQKTIIVSLSLSGAGILLAILFAFYITRSITRPLIAGVEIATRLAGGDLTMTVEVSGKDELGQLLAAMRIMVENLRRIAAQTTESSNQVHAAAEQISVASQSISQRVTEQASALEETSATMEEMAASIRLTADNANKASKVGEIARSTTLDGIRVMNETIQAMEEINRASSKIGGISGVIEEIAFQTNLLALNAAVEAARAGDHGRGFAVVATEIRSLAQRAAQSARDITTLIGESGEKVSRGVKLSEELDRKLDEIGRNIGNVVDLTTEVASAATEQSSGVGQVNVAISQIDQTTQQNASYLEESAASAEELASEARELYTLISFFKVNRDDGDDRGAGRTRLTNPAQSGSSVRFAPGAVPKPGLTKVMLATTAQGQGVEAFRDF